jgi:hypothetical protein
MVRSVDVLLTTKSAGLDRFVCPVQSVVLTPGSEGTGTPTLALIKAAEPPAVSTSTWVMPTFVNTMNGVPVAQSTLGKLRVGDLLRVGTHVGATPWMRLMEIRTDIPAVFNALNSGSLQEMGANESLDLGPGTGSSPLQRHAVFGCTQGSAAAVALRLSAPLDCTTLPLKSIKYGDPSLNSGGYFTYVDSAAGELSHADYSLRRNIRLTSTLKVPNPEDCSVVLPDGHDPLLPYPLFWKQQASGSAAMRLDRRAKHVLTVELVACTLESMPWVDLQYGHEYERPRLLVVRIESVAGTVLSNDPHLDGAFAVIPLSSDEDARFTGTQQVHRSTAWFAPVSGALNELKVSVTDQTGATFTGHWNMHFKLHLACD